jgi:hypothetical protein
LLYCSVRKAGKAPTSSLAHPTVLWEYSIQHRAHAARRVLQEISAHS